MRCVHCGQDVGLQEKECPECGQLQAEIMVLTPREREEFQGITLENMSGEQQYDQYHSSGSTHRIYVRQFSLGSGKISFWTKLLLAAVFALLIFIVLPMAMVLIFVVSGAWIIARLLRGR